MAFRHLRSYQDEYSRRELPFFPRGGNDVVTFVFLKRILGFIARKAIEEATKCTLTYPVLQFSVYSQSRKR